MSAVIKAVIQHPKIIHALSHHQFISLFIEIDLLFFSETIVSEKNL